jgi:hypothetical protein
MVIVGGWRLKYKKPPKPKKSDGKKFKEYRRRNDKLSQLGYAGYAEYLKGDDWKRVREDKLRRFPQCLLCERVANQVHHLDYSHEVLLGLRPQLLVTLCGDCHERIEFDGGEKRSLPEANAELRRLAHEAGLTRWLNMVKQHSAKRRSGKKARAKSSPYLYAAARRAAEYQERIRREAHG